MHALRRLGDAVRGAFSGASTLQRFGFGEGLARLEQRQLEQLAAVKKHTAEAAKNVEELMRAFRLR